MIEVHSAKNQLRGNFFEQSSGGHRKRRMVSRISDDARIESNSITTVNTTKQSDALVAIKAATIEVSSRGYQRDFQLLPQRIKTDTSSENQGESEDCLGGACVNSALVAQMLETSRT